ncbi:MAG: S9 family peptidase [Bacteroidetes bacterium]|nr:MAG: S9 family peptidase [Bacteroidota bacterium]
MLNLLSWTLSKVTSFNMTRNFSLLSATFLIFGLFSFIPNNFAQSSFSNEKIWGGEFRSEGVWGIRSMANGSEYTISDYSETEGATIDQYSYKTGKKVKTIVTASQAFEDAREYFSDYTFSSDERYILLTTNTENLYRHSYYADFYVFDTKTGDLAKPLTDFTKGKQRLATFSPLADKVAFVRNNNVFIANLLDGTETQVTDDGLANNIINGATDWVYEEEFGDDNGLKWSPDGSQLAYYRFDESAVKEYHMPMYGGLYPELYTYKYPKAGEVNSDVQVFIHNIKTGVNHGVAVPKSAHYIPRFFWTKNSDQLCILTMNRHQNDLRFLVTEGVFPANRIGTREIFKETSYTYIDIHDNLIFLEDGHSFLWTSERDGYNHIYEFDYDGSATQLTQGEWDVVDFFGYDKKKDKIYFSSSMFGPTQQHLHSTDRNGNISTLDDTPGHHSADFSSNFEYRIHNYSNANTPPVYSLRNRKGSTLRVLKDNSSLRNTLSNYNYSDKTFFTFENSSGVELNCWQILPPNFDSSQSYPVYVAIYGGPGVNTVTDSWGGANLMFYQYLAQEGYIVASVDPRGTPLRGRKFEHSTYKELGKLETSDFIDFAKYMGNLEYVNAERIGIQGWSYGGFMTLLCMTKGADVYNAGISIAPVTNWKYYDSIYTERFMETPQENESGYEDNSPVNHADKLEGALLLVHGSGDDNVHFQNSMEMVNALVDANKSFDFFVYPDRNHGIYGGNTRLHLFNMMMDFVKENF